MNDIETPLITVVLSDTSGTVKELLKDFNIYQKSKQSILLRVLVPKSLIGEQIVTQYFDTNGQIVTESGVYTALKMGMVRVDERGIKTKTGSYYLHFLKEAKTKYGDYLVYERMMPNSFTYVSGTGINAPRIVFNLVNILNNVSIDENGNAIHDITELNVYTSQECRLDVLPSTLLDQDPQSEPSEWDLLRGQVDDLLRANFDKVDKNSAILKYDLKAELPVGIVFNKEGYKTPSVLYLNAEYELPNTDYTTDSCVGAVLVTNIRMEDETLNQTEFFFYDTGISQRTIELNTDLTVRNVGEWSIKVDRKQKLSHVGEFLYVDKHGNINFTKAIKDLITKAQGKVLTEETSTYDYSSMFKITAKNKEEIEVDGSDELKKVFKEVSYDSRTGILSFARYNGDTFNIDLPLELIVKEGYYDELNQELVLVLANGEEIKIPVGDLIDTKADKIDLPTVTILGGA